MFKYAFGKLILAKLPCDLPSSPDLVLYQLIIQKQISFRSGL